MTYRIGHVGLVDVLVDSWNMDCLSIGNGPLYIGHSFFRIHEQGVRLPERLGPLDGLSRKCPTPHVDALHGLVDQSRVIDVSMSGESTIGAYQVEDGLVFGHKHLRVSRVDLIPQHLCFFQHPGTIPWVLQSA